ncbi:MAG: hypothetical protein ABI459_05805, partial [Deltaproteobacteria bacterium]
MSKMRKRKGLDGVDISPFQWVTLFTIALFVIVPFYSSALGGFKSIGELRTHPFGLPETWNTQNYTDILTSGRFFTFLWNSMKIAFVTVALTLVTSSMAAFALAHVKFFGRSAIRSLFLLGLLFPFATAILPLF